MQREPLSYCLSWPKQHDSNQHVCSTGIMPVVLVIVSIIKELNIIHFIEESETYTFILKGNVLGINILNSVKFKRMQVLTLRMLLLYALFPLGYLLYCM